MRSRERLDALIYGEIDRRRATGERGEDILSLLLDATDEDGESLERRHIRDEVMTLLFAGHDTTTSTVAFMFYELARNPEVLDDPAITRRDDPRRDAAQVPARLHRAAALGRGVRVRRRDRCPAGAHVALLLVGQPPPAGRVARARASSARSASARRTRRSCRWAPTCRSAAARAPASGCASARPRSR